MKKQEKMDAALRAQIGEGETFSSIVRRLCRENKLAVVSAVVICLFALAAIFAPVLTPYEFDEMDLLSRLSAPSAKHLLGTD